MILQVLSSAQGRSRKGLSDEATSQLDDAVLRLEASVGVIEPTKDPLLDGKWRLL